MSTTGAATGTSAVVIPQGFPTVTIEVARADGTKVELCVLLADNPADRSRGLMDVTSLGRYGGMLFRWDEQTTSQFYMLKTRIPLAIAWFAAGRLARVDRRHGAVPQRRRRPAVPPLQRRGPYLDAIELPEGGLEAAGIAPGSKLAVTNRSC